VFDQFKVRLRVSFIGGVLLSAPVWLYQLGAFITPALHRKEKRYAGGFLAVSLLLFAIGTVFAYLTISQGLDFLLRIGGEDIDLVTGVQSYLDFVVLCLVAFGVAFQFPVLVTFLNMLGMFPVAKMRAWRRGMYVAIFAAAAVITPSQDPFTFVIMAIPICLMYEGCILIARIRDRSAQKRRAADPVLGLDDDETSSAGGGPSPLDVEAPAQDGTVTAPDAGQHVGCGDDERRPVAGRAVRRLPAPADGAGAWPSSRPATRSASTPSSGRRAPALEEGRGVLVAAPTGAGKTVVGEFAVHLACSRAASASTRPRSRRCRTRSTPTCAPGTARTGSGCSPATRR
jgi:sec-independent protein translocase protein TatC